MLLNAAAGQNKDAKSQKEIDKKQAEILHNVSKLIDKPILIQSDP